MDNYLNKLAETSERLVALQHRICENEFDKQQVDKEREDLYVQLEDLMRLVDDNL